VNALQQLPIVNDVNVAFVGGVSKACNLRNSTSSNAGFVVTFVSVVDMNGNLPLMTSVTSNLHGMRYIKVSQLQAGDAPISGSFKLSFNITFIIIVYILIIKILLLKLK
jgi:hypothetical protein